MTIRVSLACVVVACLFSVANAGVVLQADFNGTGTGTGGASDLVTLGGTGELLTKGSATANVLTSSSMGGGAYLELSSPSGTGTVTWPAEVRITPTSSSTSLASMFSKPSGLPSLNGGFDFLFRSGVEFSKDNAAVAESWFRAFDADYRDAGDTNVNTNGLRLNLMNSVAGKIGVNVFTNNYYITEFNGVSQTTCSQVYANSGYITMAANEVWHLGVMFSTDASGLITMKLFGVAGTGAIDTTSATNLLGSCTFKLDATKITNGFTPGAFDFGLYSDKRSPKTQDFDCLRIYDATPTQFAAVPEPATLGLLGLGGLVLGIRRNRSQ